MQLNVLSSDSAPAGPWYADGLKFTCSQCGNCCTGGAGYVWISRAEIVRLSEFLKLPPEDVVERFCRKVDGRFSLKERRTKEGLYDCIFLKEVGSDSGASASPFSPRKACSIYSVRPLQCRTWPFWKENLRDAESWDRSSKRCHGMNGGRQFSLTQIEAIRDANDWPANPPTSIAGTEARSKG
jgi:hypothetical protein